MTPADLDEDVRSTLLKLRADGHKLAAGIGPAANSLLADFRLQKLSDLLNTPA